MQCVMKPQDETMKNVAFNADETLCHTQTSSSREGHRKIP